MEALFIFIAKSTGLIVLFYCAYFFLLRKETFFNSNRWFLLAGLITSVVLPFIVYTKVVWVNPTPIDDFSKYQVFASDNNSAQIEMNWNLILIAIYGIGVLALLIKLAVDFYSLNTVLKGKKIKQQADFKFIDVKENIAPFSYFDYIVYNSSLYSNTELESILEHEKVHSEQNHTIDVLVSRIFCVLFWFNPIAWLYKKAILQNLEFIADSEAAQKIADKKAYQYTLLKITTHENCVAITNHFYQSLIKKRIIMLNKNQSKKSNAWKFCVVIPALAAFVLLFQVEVIAKEKQQIVKEVTAKDKAVDIYKISKNSTDEQLKEIKEKLKTIHNIDFEASEIKRNAQNNLTSIKIDVKRGDQQAQSIQKSGTQVIKDFGILITTDEKGNKTIGIQTSEETADAPSKEPKKATSKKLQTKIDNDASTNSNTNTKTNSNTATYTMVNVDEKTTTNVVVSSNKNGKTTSNVVISSKSQPNVKITGDKLIIVDGEVMEGATTEDLQKLTIKTMSVFTGSTAVSKYGEEGKNGVIVIETYK